MSFDTQMKNLSFNEPPAPIVTVSLPHLYALIENRPSLCWRRWATFSTLAAAAMLLLAFITEPRLENPASDDETIEIIYDEGEVDEIDD